MDKKNKGDKFRFATEEEFELENQKKMTEEEETDNKNPEEMDIDFLREDIDNKTRVKVKEAIENKNKLPNKIHYSFEARVITMILFIIGLIAIACLLMVESLKYQKSEIIHYNEKSNVRYNVCLVDNSCVAENLNYLASQTNNIRISFQYDAVYSQKIDQNANYYISAITKISEKNNPNNELYKNEEIILNKENIKEEENKTIIDSTVTMNYAKYNTVAWNYKNSYSNEIESEVEFILYLEEDKETRKIASLKVPLGEDEFHVTKRTINNGNRTLEIKKDNWEDKNTAYATIATSLLIIAMFLIYKTTKLVLIVTKNRNKYQQRITQLLRDYDRIIVIARDGYESNKTKAIIKVESFEELLDAKDSLKKPIIYSRVNDVKSDFIVEDENKLFKYTVKEADFQ